MRTQRKEGEVNDLLNLISSLPKANTEASPDEPKKKNDKWKLRSSVNIANKGRVNRTRGK
jgi:hypothetical protein